MSQQSEWVERVNRMTANTAHEAINLMIEQARADLERSSAELGERITGFDERLAEVQATITKVVAEAQDGIGGGVIEALERSATSMSEQLLAQQSEVAARLRATFDEAIERVQQQFALQSEHLLEEVATLVRSLEERLDRLASLGPQDAASQEAEPHPVEAALDRSDEEPAEPWRFMLPAGSPEAPEFTISLVETATTDPADHHASANDRPTRAG